MLTPEAKAIEKGATHFKLKPHGREVSLYYKRDEEKGCWLYLGWDGEWEHGEIYSYDLPHAIERPGETCRTT